jgi:hypothetical protein
MDYSFISFFGSINQDLFESNATQITRYNDIHLLPNERYLFYTNINGGYTLQGTNVFEFVDCANNVLGVANVTVYQLLNNQFIWELLPSNNDFFNNPVRLRMNNELWSNPFIYSTYRASETVRIDFKDKCELDGVGYDFLSVMQGVRVKLWLEKPEVNTQVTEYTTLYGTRVGARPISTLECNFIGDFITNKTYLALTHALKCDVIYINGKRATDKATPKWSDAYAIDFNQKKIDFKMAFNDKDTFDYSQAQIMGDYDSNDYDNDDYLVNI